MKTYSIGIGELGNAIAPDARLLMLTSLTEKLRPLVHPTVSSSGHWLIASAALYLRQYRHYFGDIAGTAIIHGIFLGFRVTRKN
jgi:hypothetical protein